ncbi:MAG: hydroxyacid dehydrogenase [Patescibacteria group bacterium]
MSKSIHILVTEPEYFTPESLRSMEKVGKVIAKRMTRNELLRAIENVDVLVVRIETNVDRELLRHAKRLRCVVSTTTGLNHINVRALELSKILLFSLRGTHSVSTAEHALALLFSAARNIPTAHTHIKDGGWTRWKYIGTELTGKTLGIFGIGRVGTEIAKRARGLHMNVIAYDPYVKKNEIARRGATKVARIAFIKKSDFISLHAPLTKETKGFFGQKEIHMMKQSAILINTARGAIVEERALLEALKNQRIRAAAIDVYQEEPLPSSSPLLRYARKHQNLILTPHIGASTEEALRNASAFAAKNIRRFFGLHK